jgi:MFS family permease
MVTKHLGLPHLKGAEGFLIAVLIDALGSGLFIPFSLLYFHVALGLPLISVGFALSTATIFTLPIAPLTGLLVDRFGAKRVVMAAQVLQGCGFLGYLMVNSLLTMIGYVLLASIGQRLFWSAYFTLVADIATEGERDRWYGLAGAAQNAGIGVGGLASGFLIAASGTAGYHLIVIVNALSFFLAAALLLFSRRVPHHSPTSSVQVGGYRTVLRDRPFLALTLTNVMFAMGSMLLAVGIPLYLITSLKVPVWVVGAIFALNTTLLALLQTLLVRKLEAYRRTRALMFAGMLWGGWCLLCTLALVLPPGALLPYLFSITCIYTLAELIHAPTSNALAAAVSPDALRGRYLALFQFAWSIASILTPGLFTLLFTIHPSLPWGASALLMLLASLVIYLLERHLPAYAVRTRSTQPKSSRQEQVSPQGIHP